VLDTLTLGNSGSWAIWLRLTAGETTSTSKMEASLSTGREGC